MGSREWGSSGWIRVVANEEQWRRWWPDFARSIAHFRFVGFNCKFNAPNVLRQMKAVGVDPDSKDLTDKYLSATSSWSDYEGDYEGPSSLLHIRDANSSSGRVSLIELASFDGKVLLLRCCFFHSLPNELRRLLEHTSVVKIGQGLEKDERHLRESFAVSFNGYLDIRNVCLMWPWFTANYSFHKFGILSIAHFLFAGGDPERDYHRSIRSPFYITKRLEAEQIKQAARETQLTVDVFVFVALRCVGWRLPRDWRTNVDFGQLVHLLVAAPRLDQSYLDNKLRSTNLRLALPVAAKKICDKEHFARLKQAEVISSSAAMATQWAWPLPRKESALDAMLTRFPAGDATPCRGRPFLAVDLSRLSSSCPDRFDRSFRVRATVNSIGGRRKVYSVLLRVRDIDGTDGCDGCGRPLDVRNLMADGLSDEHDAFVYKEMLPRVMAAATRQIDHIRMKHEWMALEGENRAASVFVQQETMLDEEYRSKGETTLLERNLPCAEPSSVQMNVFDKSERGSGAAFAFKGLPYLWPIWQQSNTTKRTSKGYFAHPVNGRFEKAKSKEPGPSKCQECHRTPTKLTVGERIWTRSTFERRPPPVETMPRLFLGKGGFDRPQIGSVGKNGQLQTKEHDGDEQESSRHRGRGGLRRGCARPACRPYAVLPTRYP